VTSIMSTLQPATKRLNSIDEWYTWFQAGHYTLLLLLHCRTLLLFLLLRRHVGGYVSLFEVSRGKPQWFRHSALS